MLALLTMAASVPTRTLLFQNHQVSVTLEHTDAAHLDHLQITALPNQTTIERATIDAVTRETERILNARRAVRHHVAPARMPAAVLLHRREHAPVGHFPSQVPQLAQPTLGGRPSGVQAVAQLRECNFARVRPNVSYTRHCRRGRRRRIHDVSPVSFPHTSGGNSSADRMLPVLGDLSL